MNIVVPTSQPAPKIYSLSSRIIAITSVIVIFTLIIALTLQCVKSWHINFIDDLTIIACVLAHLCWVLSTVNMLCQDVPKWLIRMSRAALITPNVVIAVTVVFVLVVEELWPEFRHIKSYLKLMDTVMFIIAFTPPIIAWISNTVTVISSMIKVHKYLKS